MLEGEAAVVMRNTQVSLKKTIYNDFKEILTNTGLIEYFNVPKSFPLRITSKVGTGECIFLGADKGADDNKGLKPTHGAGRFTIFFGDECDQISKAAIMQMRIRMRGESSTGKDTRYIYSFNPTFFQHYLFQDFILPTGFDPYADVEDPKNLTLRTEDTLVARCTYKDNSFLQAQEIKELKNLGKQSKYFEQVYLRAEPGVLGDRCIESFEVIEAKDVPKNLNLEAGMDFGWNDPIAYVKGGYDRANNTVYIIEEFYRSKCDLNTVAEAVDKSVPILADSEDPRSIATLKKKGLVIRPAKKGPGSVFGGIMWLNSVSIKVVKSCTNMITSLENYSWKKNPLTDESTDVPDHTFSHMCDSVRYMLSRHSSGSSGIQFGRARST